MPSPRQRQPVPLPRTRVPEDVMRCISFESPLESEVNLRHTSIAPKQRSTAQPPPYESAHSPPADRPPPLELRHRNLASGPPNTDYEPLYTPPPNYPPPPPPNETTYDFPRRETVELDPLVATPAVSSATSSVYDLQYENFTPVVRISNPQQQIHAKYENFIPRASAQARESILVHFDPIHQNQFVDNDEHYTETLEDIFRLQPVAETASDPDPDASCTSASFAGSQEISSPTARDIGVFESNTESRNESIPEVRVGSVISPQVQVGSDVKAATSNGTSSPEVQAGSTAVSADDDAIVRTTRWYDERVPPPPVRQDSIPREDVSKLRTGILGQLSMANVSDDPRRNKRVSFKNFAKLLHRSTTPGVVHATQRQFLRPAFGAVNKHAKFSGVLSQPGRDRVAEWRVVLGRGLVTWSSDKESRDVKLLEITSLASFAPPILNRCVPRELTAVCWRSLEFNRSQ